MEYQTVFIHDCIMINLTKLITECLCSVYLHLRNLNVTETRIHKNQLQLILLELKTGSYIFGYKKANFCQQVLKPLGLYQGGGGEFPFMDYEGMSGPKGPKIADLDRK